MIKMKSVSIKVLCAGIFLLLITVLATGYSLAKEGKKEIKVEGEYKNQSAVVTVSITDPDSLEITEDDYFEYLDEVQIGEGLTIPLKTDEDLAKMNQTATSDALLENERIVRTKKAEKADSKIIKTAQRKADRAAKEKYDAIWNQPSENMKLPEDTSGMTKTYMDYKTVT